MTIREGILQYRWLKKVQSTIPVVGQFFRETREKSDTTIMELTDLNLCSHFRGDNKIGCNARPSSIQC